MILYNKVDIQLACQNISVEIRENEIHYKIEYLKAMGKKIRVKSYFQKETFNY